MHEWNTLFLLTGWKRHTVEMRKMKLLNLFPPSLRSAALLSCTPSHHACSRHRASLPQPTRRHMQKKAGSLLTCNPKAYQALGFREEPGDPHRSWVIPLLNSKLTHKQDSGDGLHLHSLPHPAFFSIPATSHVQAYGPLHLSIHLWVRVSACSPAWNACDGHLSSPRRRRIRRGNFLPLLSKQIELRLMASVIILWKITCKRWFEKCRQYFYWLWKSFTTRSTNYFTKWTITFIKIFSWISRSLRSDKSC